MNYMLLRIIIKKDTIIVLFFQKILNAQLINLILKIKKQILYKQNA